MITQVTIPSLMRIKSGAIDRLGLYLKPIRAGTGHLISHALDAISQRTRLHGLQVGVATYLISRVQKI